MSDQKNIVIAIESLTGGGAEKVMLVLARELIARGHRVIMLLLKHKIDYPVPDGLTVKVLPPQTGKPRRRQNSKRLQARALEQLINEELPLSQVDLILSNLPQVDKLVTLIHHPNIVCVIHNNLSRKYLANRTGFKRWNIARKLRSAYRGKQLVCVSEGLKEDVKQLGIRTARCQTIYNPVDTTAIQQLADAYEPEAPQDYLLHIGSFKRQKRHDRLLRAYAKSGIAAPLVLLGQGPDEAQIRQRVASMGLEHRVIFAGFHANPYPFLKRARMLVLSSDYEGLPTVLVESLVCHTPMVSVDCPSGPAEIMTGPLATYLVPVEDEARLAQAMAAMWRQPVVIGPQNYAQFDLAHTVDAYLALAGQ